MVSFGLFFGLIQVSATLAAVFLKTRRRVLTIGANHSFSPPCFDYHQLLFIARDPFDKPRPLKNPDFSPVAS
jgi:hypothetical protein